MEEQHEARKCCISQVSIMHEVRLEGSEALMSGKSRHCLPRASLFRASGKIEPSVRNVMERSH